jgi:hypothetical protein
MSYNHENYIPDDGYTEPGYIAAIPGLHGPLQFKFRPTLVADQPRWARGSESNVSDAVWDQQCAGLMAERIVSWSLVSPKGEPVPICASSLLRLKPKIFTKLFGILLGVNPSDIDPKWDNQQVEEVLRDVSSAATDGTTPGMAREARNEKN